MFKIENRNFITFHILSTRLQTPLILDYLIKIALVLYNSVAVRSYFWKQWHA